MPRMGPLVKSGIVAFECTHLSASIIGNTFEGRELSRKRVEIFRQGIREITQELT